jgi:hypothetical protein
MSTTTLLGYNRDGSTNSSTQVLGLGTNLVDKNGDAIVVPAGWVVVEVQLRHVASTPAPADAGGEGTADAIEVRCGSDNLCRGTFINLTSSNHLAVVGTGTNVLPTLAKSSPVTLKLHGVDVGSGDADLANNGALFACVIKMRPLPSL